MKMRLLKVYFVIVALLLLSEAHASVIYVRYDAPGPAWDGVSWQTAFQHIKEAMEVAQYGDEIWVSKGIYKDDLINTQMKNGVKLYGGFIGNETSVSQRDWLQNQTIVSRSDIPGDPIYKFLLCKGTDSTTTIDGISFQKGSTFWTNSDDECQFPSEGISNCTGGAIFVYSPHPDTLGCLKVLNCTFRENTGRFGSAIGVNLTDGSGGIYVDNCRFEEGFAGDGGIYIFTGDHQQWMFEVKNTAFIHNKATGWGAPAISFVSYSYDAFLSIQTSIFEDNFCEGLPGSGAVSHFKAMGRYGEFTNCSFRNNDAGTSQFVPGSGALSGTGMIVTSCLFIGNRAFSGGALRSHLSKVVNCIFIENSASNEAGAIWSSGDTYVVNCTFFDNYSEKQSIFLNAVTGDYYFNNVFSNNRTGDGSPLFKIYDTITVAHCAFDALDTTSLFNLTIEGVLYFNPVNLLGLNPMFHDTAGGDLSLLPCSPLIDQGDSSYLSNFNIIKDYAGNPRLLGGNVDIGAYETVPVNFFWATDSIATGWTITLDVPPNYDVQWSANTNGQTGPVASGLAAGIYYATVTDQSGCSTVVGPVVVGTVGTEQPDAILVFHLSPNPTSDIAILTVQLKQPMALEVLVSNQLGQIVFSQKMTKQKADNVMPIELEGLSPGLFFVQIRLENGETKVTQIVVSRV
ncbi:MAG: hypothetical protein EPGJADBJ_00504 [Saprospiraceae bacterium]|nr:hypothetical protein [Saprospiraceae bacterium]